MELLIINCLHAKFQVNQIKIRYDPQDTLPHYETFVQAYAIKNNNALNLWMGIRLKLTIFIYYSNYYRIHKQNALAEFIWVSQCAIIIIIN